MKRFAAQYIITCSGPPLNRAVITAEDDGTIINVDQTGGDLKELASTEFYNGIIIPGFVNCHCHLELSHLRGSTSKSKGLGTFIQEIRTKRAENQNTVISAALSGDRMMYNEGIVLCADICNTPDTFSIKKRSKIRYINLLEVFGIDPDKAAKRFGEILKVAEVAGEMDLPFSIVPHSAYSMSITLLNLLKNESSDNYVTSVHFMETDEEQMFLHDHSGPLSLSYERGGLMPHRLETAECHAEIVLNYITRSGSLILVHNTFADRNTIRRVKERDGLFWCLCPNSNNYISGTFPPLKLLLEERCEIVMGTDSLASNTGLSILEELKTVQENSPGIPINDLVVWATLNGARALGEQHRFGSIEAGKKPGLLLIENVDLQKLKLLPESFVTRLI